MDIMNSLFVSVFGMTVVFFALVLLIVMINVMSFGVRRASEKQAVKDKAAAGSTALKTAATDVKAEAPASTLVVAANHENLANVYSGPPELKLTGVDEKTAAIIMAIVCDTSGIAPNELYFKSIKALD